LEIHEEENYLSLAGSRNWGGECENLLVRAGGKESRKAESLSEGWWAEIKSN
jgi:hypothetical protein